MNTTFEDGILMNGDCLELMKKLPDNSVDMILCDLPYGTTQNKWDSLIPFDPLWEQYWRVAKENAAVVLTAQCPFDKILGMSQIKYLKYEWIWQKSKATGHLNAKKQPMKNHENVLVFYKKQCIYNPQDIVLLDEPLNIKPKKTTTNYGKHDAPHVREYTNYPRSIKEFSSEGKTIHPTQKPVELFEYMIKTYTNEGAVVLDNCSGSGTTAIAAIRSNRKFICMEMNEEYYNKSVDRVNDEYTAKNSQLKFS